MSKLDRWLIASKEVKLFDAETSRGLAELGVQLGGGWTQVHRHLLVTPQNKEQVISFLEERGYKVTTPSDQNVAHPENLVYHHDKKDE